jgi:hypothetical protein
MYRAAASGIMALGLLLAANSGRATAEPPPEAQNRIASLWAELSSPDDGKAARAVLALARTPKETMAYIQENLRPVKDDPIKVAGWIADLDDDQIAVRAKATRELEYLGKCIKPHLEQALQNKPSLETATRIKDLLDKMPKPPEKAKPPVMIPEKINSVAIANGKVKLNGIPLEDLVTPILPPAPSGPPSQWIRAARAVALLEHIGTAEARTMLEDLAKGEADAIPTMEAAAALERMKKGEK